MLKVENLSVNYGYITALSEISFHVDQGEIITLIGSNGAGKTTSLHAISGLVHKAGGSVQFKGTDISRMAPDKIVKMGMCHVPEGRKIFPALSVYEKLFPRLKERLTQAGGSLSGGEQQMLAISRGLMMDPDIVMLDEPSLGLAPIIVEGIFDLILQIRDMGKTILLIEQNASMALSIADRGYVLETGKIIMEGKGKDLLTDPRVKAAYLGA